MYLLKLVLHDWNDEVLAARRFLRAPTVLELSDGKIVRFDQYVDSATINPTLGV